MDKYLKYLNFNNDVFSIYPYELDIYQISDGVSSDVLISKEFFDLIKDKIPKTITKLEIPFDYIKYDFNFLKSFPNLKELTITSYDDYNLNILKTIYEETSIRKINTNLIIIFHKDDILNKDNYTLTSGGFDSVFYKDLILCNIDEINNDYLNIYTKKIDKDNLIRLDKVIKEKNIFKINIYEGNNIVNIDFINDNEVIIKVNNDINLLESLYNFMKDRYKINKCVFKSDVILSDNTILDKINKECNLKIIYDIEEVDYEEYIGLYESIKYYRMLINDNKLSPLEKVMYAYDIMKTFKYSMSENDPFDSRDPHKIIQTGKIVCVGYSDMMKLILNGIDKNINVKTVMVKGYDKKNDINYNHARNVVRIDDDKYNIHGIYSLDATWDSVKENKEGKLGRDYNALDLYTNFLIPITKEQYSKIYSHEEEPVIEGYFHNSEFLGFERLFDNVIDKETLNKYLNVERPSLEIFISALKNVRLSEGFDKDLIDGEVKKVIEKNNIVIEESKKNDIYEEFFKSK